MFKIPRRIPSMAAPAFAIALLAPAVAEAQQLFPNAPIFIRRQRPACATEPPYYKYVRQQYYGYYPTCWRKWPTGWQCPCGHPEPPDLAASLRERPLEATAGGVAGEENPNTGSGEGPIKPLNLQNEPKLFPDDENPPGAPPPMPRGDRLDDAPSAKPAVPDGGANAPRASVEDPNATVAAGDVPELPPVSLSNDDSPGAIDPVPSPVAAETQPPVAAPANGSMPALRTARPPQRRGFIGALIGRIRRG